MIRASFAKRAVLCAAILASTLTGLPHAASAAIVSTAQRVPSSHVQLLLTQAPTHVPSLALHALAEPSVQHGADCVPQSTSHTPHAAPS